MGTAPHHSQGDYTLTLIAFDDFGGSEAALFLLHVVNRAPVLVKQIGTQPVFYTLHFTISLNGTFEDPDGDSITYDVTLSDGTPLSNTGWLNFDPNMHILVYIDNFCLCYSYP